MYERGGSGRNGALRYQSLGISRRENFSSAQAMAMFFIQSLEIAASQVAAFRFRTPETSNDATSSIPHSRTEIRLEVEASRH
jgi:hypothetical protein